MALRPCYLPPKFLVDCALEGNRIRQLRYPGISAYAEVVPYTLGKQQGELLTLDGKRVMISQNDYLRGTNLRERS